MRLDTFVWAAILDTSHSYIGSATALPDRIPVYSHDVAKVCPTTNVAGGTRNACCLREPTEQEWLRLILQRVGFRSCLR